MAGDREASAEGVMVRPEDLDYCAEGRQLLAERDTRIGELEARIAELERRRDELLVNLSATSYTAKKLAELEARIERLLQRHKANYHGVCRECHHKSPCPEERILRGDGE